MNEGNAFAELERILAAESAPTDNGGSDAAGNGGDDEDVAGDDTGHDGDEDGWSGDDLSRLLDEPTKDNDEDDGDDDGEDSGDGDEDAEDGDAADRPKGLSKGVQKRIDRLTAQKRELKDQLAKVEAEAAAAKAEALAASSGRVVLAPSASNPLADVATATDLESRVEQARQVRDWCIENPDGGSLQDAQGNEVEFTAAQVAKRKAIAEDILHVHAPARREWIAQQAEAQAVARKKYSKLYEKGSPWANMKERFIQANPGVLALPDHDLVIGDIIVGFMVRSGKLNAVIAKQPAKAKQGESGGAQQPAGKPKPPPAAIKPAATRAPGKQAAAQAAMNRYAQTQSEEDGIAAIMGIL